MSNLMFRQFRQYYQLPYLSPDLERTLTPVAFKYYALLWREANTRSAGELQFSNAEITKMIGIRCNKTLAKARTELEGAGLIACRRVPPGIYSHVMLSQDGHPIATPKDRKGVRLYSSTSRLAPSASFKSKAQPLPFIPPITPLLATSLIHRECRIHKLVPHWRRPPDEYICEKCHPNPNGMGSNTHSSSPRPLTATEIGFV